MQLFVPCEDPQWGGWVLPVSTGDGKLLDIGLYGRDVLCFAEEFLKLSGLAKDETKLKNMDALEIAGTSAESMSLESRNRQLVTNCFFNQGFHQNVRALQESCGVVYLALSESVLRNEELQVETVIDSSFQQFFEGFGAPSALAQSIWATDTGFFYNLQLQPAQTCNKKFTTPVWCIKAVCICHEFNLSCNLGVKPLPSTLFH